MSRRMFTPEIVESDSFYDLPESSQSLYLHLCMNADDDGFVNTANRIVKIMGIEKEALSALVETKFVLKIRENVFCIKHWMMHNKIRQDRKKKTAYQEELSALIVNENGSYSQKIHRTRTFCGQNAVNSPSVCGQLPDNSPHRVGKDRVGEDRIGESAHAHETPSPSLPTDKKVFGKYKNVFLSEEEMKNFAKSYPDHWEDRIHKFSEYLHDSGKTYSSHYDKLVRWAKEDKVPMGSSKAEKSYDIDEFFAAAVAR